MSLTAYLLVELSKKKVKVIFCDERSNPSSELCNFYGSYDTSRKIKEQISWQEETKNLVWAEIVRAKIKGQLESLFRDIIYRKYNVLIVERYDIKALIDEQKQIIDMDLCEI